LKNCDLDYRSQKIINMKFLKTFFLFTPFFAAGQINSQTVSKCQEINYQFYRQGQQEQQSSKTYDAQGKLLKQIDIFSSKNTGNYTSEYAYEYDAKGNNSQVIYTQNGQIRKITTKKYSATGSLISETSSAEGKATPLASLTANNGESVQVFYAQDGITELTKEKTTVNKAGQLTKKEISTASGNLMMSNTKRYDLQGNLTQDVHFDAADKVTLQTDYEYNTQGNLLKDKTLRNNILYAETDYEYDLAGKTTKKTRLNGSSKVDYYFTYEYDAQENMSKENYFYNNQVISVPTFEYDANGNKIKESYLDRTGKVSMNKVWTFVCK
jgi:YD repeat-containing protein